MTEFVLPAPAPTTVSVAGRAALGSVLAPVPAELCGHPRRETVWLAVNGIQRQRADLSDLLWPVAEMVAMGSRSVTLLPGDLIYTGTPAGVGPLQPSDVVSGGVADVGQFSMTVGAIGQ